MSKKHNKPKGNQKLPPREYFCRASLDIRYGGSMEYALQPSQCVLVSDVWDHRNPTRHRAQIVGVSAVYSPNQWQRLDWVLHQFRQRATAASIVSLPMRGLSPFGAFRMHCEGGRVGLGTLNSEAGGWVEYPEVDTYKVLQFWENSTLQSLESAWNYEVSWLPMMACEVAPNTHGAKEYWDVHTEKWVWLRPFMPVQLDPKAGAEIAHGALCLMQNIAPYVPNTDYSEIGTKVGKVYLIRPTTWNCHCEWHVPYNDSKSVIVTKDVAVTSKDVTNKGCVWAALQHMDHDAAMARDSVL